MKKITKFLALATMLIGIGVPCKVYGQNTVNTVQPTIMVVPYTKEGQDIRTVLEGDVNKRAVLTAIKEAFDNRGFTTVDFLGKMKAMSNQAAFNDNNQSDIKSDIIQNSGADIFVDAEIDINKSSQGTSVNVILTAYDTSTGASLANKNGNSGRFYTDDIVKLADVAIKKNMDQFLDNLQTKFNDIVANGRSIIVNIGFDEDSPYDMSYDIRDDGYLLSDIIEEWMEDNAFKNYYHIQGTTDKAMIFDVVKIPIRDPQSGKNYRIGTFAGNFQRFLKSLGLESTRNINGWQVYISIK